VIVPSFIYNKPRPPPRVLAAMSLRQSKSNGGQRTGCGPWIKFFVIGDLISLTHVADVKVDIFD